MHLFFIANADGEASVIRQAMAASAVAKGSKSIRLKWTKVTGADKYVIYGAKCGKGTYKKLKELSAKKAAWTKKGLKKNTEYKFYVAALKTVNGTEMLLAKSPGMHVITGNVKGKYTNPKSISLQKTKITLKTGKTYKIKASVKKVKEGKQLLGNNHAAKLRYISSDQSIAVVNKSGKITAKGAGTCKVYVLAVNGVWETVKVTVK